MDDNKYRIVRQIITESVTTPGVVMDLAHNDDDSFSVILYNDNLATFEAGVRKNIMLSVLSSAKACGELSIPVYVERKARA